MVEGLDREVGNGAVSRPLGEQSAWGGPEGGGDGDQAVDFAVVTTVFVRLMSMLVIGRPRAVQR